LFATFSTIAVSIFLSGVFFLLIGVIVSSLIEVFVPREKIERLIPKSNVLAIAVASLIGLFFPVCECGIVPVIHRLLKKGVPLSFCVTMLLSSPIVNIVVLTSTYFAFPTMVYVVFLRFAGGFLISFFAGVIVYNFFRKEGILKSETDVEPVSCCCGHDHHDQGRHNDDVKNDRVTAVLNHATEEFFETGKYFILGILIAAVIQSTVPRAELAKLGTHYPLSNMFMMSFSYLLSVCSNTDAFIARSFMQEFNVSALLSFMIFGAMFDIKTTLMLKSVFRSNFIVKLIILVAILAFLYTSVVYFAGGLSV